MSQKISHFKSKVVLDKFEYFQDRDSLADMNKVFVLLYLEFQFFLIFEI